MKRPNLAPLGLAIAWSVCFASNTAHGQKGQMLAADLAFHFDCQGPAYPPSDLAIENFLAGHGFRVLNKVRLAKKHHVDFPFDMYIVGIDKQRRMIHFMSISLPTEYFAVQLKSPPPTHHDSDLENAVLVFVSNKLGCQTRQISRGANGEEARDFYERLFQIDEGWFRQADDLERPPS